MTESGQDNERCEGTERGTLPSAYLKNAANRRRRRRSGQISMATMLIGPMGR